MLKIRAIKIMAHAVENRVFGAEYIFKDGLNIVRGDNTAGKSTLYHSILYGLGVEEILDGKNEKSLQSVLKKSIEFDNKNYEVIESSIFLEIESDEIVTVKRSVVNSSRSPKLVEVFFGATITGVAPVTRIESMYVHDKGAATDAFYGFHAFLEKFMGWSLPTVIGSLGDNRNLYIQSVFPAFVIEQKKGWSDFLATTPYFGVKDSESRVIEFLLNLDVIVNRRRKQELAQLRQELLSKWHINYNDLIGTAKRGGAEVQGITNVPEILDNNPQILFTVRHEGERKSLVALITAFKRELAYLITIPIETSGSKVSANKSLLKDLQQQLSELTVTSSFLSNRITMSKIQAEQYDAQLRELNEDLEKNKSISKIYDLGAAEQISVAVSRCPTCLQDIKDTLMPQSVSQSPMRIDENISYLAAQKAMIELHLEIQGKSLVEDTESYESCSDYMNETRDKIRSVQSELVADKRAPSEADIEKRVKLKANINFFLKLIDELTVIVNNLKATALEWRKLLGEESGLPEDFFSVIDRKKLTAFENTFKALAAAFGYSSTSLRNVKISQDKYLPIIQSDTVRYNIRADSSATDLVRSIWAYTCALRRVSDGFKGNHPKLLMFDEPAQHSMSDENFTTFLEEIASYPDGQSFIFASFNNSDIEFNSITQGIKFTLNRIEGKLIKPIENN